MLQKNIDSLSKILTEFPSAYVFRGDLFSILQVPPNWGFHNRLSSDYHLIYVYSGTGTYWIDEHEVGLVRGMLIMLGPGVRYGAMRGEGDLKIMSMRFRCVHRETGEDFNLRGVSMYGILRQHNPDLWNVHADNLYRAYQSTSGIYRHEQFSACLYSYLVDFLHALESDAPSFAGEEGLRCVYSFITSHPLDRTSQEDLAKMASLSPKYFTRQFKILTGRSPKQFQVDCRLEYARFLLEETDSNVKQVAKELGYPDPFMFSKQFKARFGFSPKQSKSLE